MMGKSESILAQKERKRMKRSTRKLELTKLILMTEQGIEGAQELLLKKLGENQQTSGHNDRLFEDKRVRKVKVTDSYGVETIYNACVDAAEELNISSGTILKHMKEKTADRRGRKFEYIE